MHCAEIKTMSGCSLKHAFMRISMMHFVFNKSHVENTAQKLLILELLGTVTQKCNRQAFYFLKDLQTVRTFDF